MIKLYLARYRLEELKDYLRNQFLILENDINEQRLSAKDIEQLFDTFRLEKGAYIQKYAIKYSTAVCMETDTVSEINTIIRDFETRIEARVKKIENEKEDEQKKDLELNDVKAV